ncbi:hypothetical protein TNCV_279171 [Trichonephila clavipes]|nr:hypothetical protein TNCV_279171 [Trichonephila clavipes]
MIWRQPINPIDVCYLILILPAFRGFTKKKKRTREYINISSAMRQGEMIPLSRASYNCNEKYLDVLRNSPQVPKSA